MTKPSKNHTKRIEIKDRKDVCDSFYFIRIGKQDCKLTFARNLAVNFVVVNDVRRVERTIYGSRSAESINKLQQVGYNILKEVFTPQKPWYKRWFR